MTNWLTLKLGKVTLSFVHGGFQDYRLWEQHLPVFSKGYRVIAYSRRNHFPNSTSNDGLPDGAADAHGEDLAAFLTALGVKQAHIVAHSSGATPPVLCVKSSRDGANAGDQRTTRLSADRRNARGRRHAQSMGRSICPVSGGAQAGRHRRGAPPLRRRGGRTGHLRPTIR